MATFRLLWMCPCAACPGFRLVARAGFCPEDRAIASRNCAAAARVFRLPLVSIAGRHLEAKVVPSAGAPSCACAMFPASQLELTQLRERHARSLMDIEGLRTMLDALPDPVWCA